MVRTLWVAALYSFWWTLQTICWPQLLFRWPGGDHSYYPPLWQGVGVLTGLFGVGYLAASVNPMRHWPMVMIGLLMKLLAPVGLWQLAKIAHPQMPVTLLIIVDDLIWWVPFSYILWSAYQQHIQFGTSTYLEVQELALHATTNRGHSLLEMSREAPLLVAFLRYSGCPFCREAVSDLSAQRKTIERNGCHIVLVHMEEDQETHEFLLKNSMSDLPRISDPNKTLYRAFGLGRGKLWNLIGPPLWWRGLSAAIIEKHGIGWFTSDPFQLPGIFLVFHGQILKSFTHRRASDRPNYARFIDVEADEIQAAPVL